MKYQKLASLAMGLVFLMTAIPVYAEYKPRRRKAASGYSRSGGSRGCSNQLPLTLLAPKTFVGKTASKRPNLVWYMSNSQNIRFRLFEFDVANKKVKQIGKQQEIETKVGINKLKLPADYPELTIGKTYLWQLSIDCRTGTIIKRAEFEVVNLPSNQKFTTIPENVNYYAKNGLWYEALEEALKTSENGKLGKLGSELVRELAESETLMGNTTNIKKRIEHLQKISQDNQ